MKLSKPLKIAMAAGAALGTFAASSVEVSAAPAAPPNVVIFLVDDMGWSDLGCYGGEIPTPNLDRLAQGGLRFTQFYNTARCSPSRACLLTGVYPHKAGMGYLDDLSIKDSEGTTGKLSNRAVTMAEALKPAGYFTAMSGKWHMGQTHGTPPWQRGFDRSLSSTLGASYFPDQPDRKNNPLALNGEHIPLNSPVLGSDWYGTDLWTKFGLKFVDEALGEKKPFFLYLAQPAPHFPLMAPPEDIARYRGKYLQGWDKLRQARYKRQLEMGIIDPKWPLSQRPPDSPAWDSLNDAQKDRFDHIMAIYAAMIDRMDKSVGDLVAGLEKRGVLDNTLILFLSDNGGNAESGPNGITEGDPLGGPDSRVFLGMNWATLNNTPFRRYKHFIHEGGISTPLIAHWPKGIAKNRDNQLEKQPAHLVDIMATVMEISGAKYPKKFNGHDIFPMDGISLRPTFEGRKLNRKEPIFWEHEGNRGIRDGKWKLVSKYLEPWELYDVEADRTEQHDLVKQNAALAKRMAAQWDAWAKRSLVDQWTGPIRNDWGEPVRENAANVGSQALNFKLAADAILPRAEAPRVMKREMRISAKLGEQHGDGVIVAQGGKAEGYALYVKDGKLEMATRVGGKLKFATSENVLPSGPLNVEARLGKDGRCTLQIQGKTVAENQNLDALQTMPIDGLEVGRDLEGLVGRYDEKNAFDGLIESVNIMLKD